jgi:hypothetical protein
MSEKIAFVLGNGTSRKIIDPRDLKKHGTVYGCNALYRSFAPDYLVAVDTKMISEIVDSQYHLTHSVWTNPNKYTEKIKELNLFRPSKGWSSGPTALWLASEHEYNTIYILGFDYVGLGKKNEYVNNIYCDTKNYKKHNDRATYYGNWSRQTDMCIKKFPKTKYVRLTGDVDFIPEQLKVLSNLTHESVEIFAQNFNIKPIKS